MAAPKGNKNHLKHGKRHTRIYNIWRSMRQRCQNPNCRNYHNYGGKGVCVCDEWNNSFEEFYKWAMLNGYTNELTLERKDTSGNYEPVNCRWATYEEQANNKTNNRIIEIGGEMHTMAEWAKITGIKKGTLFARLKYGWDVEKALNTPVHKKAVKV